MNPKDRSFEKLKRRILWKSPDSAYVVVRGPFPDNFFRSLCNTTVAKAAARRTELMTHQEELEDDKVFAKTLAKYVLDEDSNFNEWGEMAP